METVIILRDIAVCSTTGMPPLRLLWYVNRFRTTVPLGEGQNAPFLSNYAHKSGTAVLHGLRSKIGQRSWRQMPREGLGLPQHRRAYGIPGMFGRVSWIHHNDIAYLGFSEPCLRVYIRSSADSEIRSEKSECDIHITSGAFSRTVSSQF